MNEERLGEIESTVKGMMGRVQAGKENLGAFGMAQELLKEIRHLKTNSKWGREEEKFLARVREANTRRDTPALMPGDVARLLDMLDGVHQQMADLMVDGEAMRKCGAAEERIRIVAFLQDLAVDGRRMSARPHDREQAVLWVLDVMKRSLSDVVLEALAPVVAREMVVVLTGCIQQFMRSYQYPDTLSHEATTAMETARSLLGEQP